MSVWVFAGVSALLDAEADCWWRRRKASGIGHEGMIDADGSRGEMGKVESWRLIFSLSIRFPQLYLPTRHSFLLPLARSVLKYST